MKDLKSVMAVFFLLFLVAASACTTAPGAEPTTAAAVRVIVTQGFGQEIILDQTVNMPDKSNGLEALKLVAQVETAYGGGFINGINGIHSKYSGPGSSLQDWFFYANGMESNTGALDYTLHQGDIQQWDFHTWSFHPSIPAIIGNFPEPFRRGYGGKTRPTIIAYTSGLGEAADGLKQRLMSAGIASVSSKGIGEISESEKQSVNLLLLGTADNPLITELNRNWKRLGFLAYLEKENLVTLDANGQTVSRYGAAAGLIQATQNPWNPNGIGAGENVVWLITGADMAGVKGAADILVHHPEELKYAFAAVIVSGQVVKLPR